MTNLIPHQKNPTSSDWRHLFYHSDTTWLGVDAWLNHVDQWYRQAPDHRLRTWPESVHSSIDITRQGHNRRLSLAEYAVSSRVPLDLAALLQTDSSFSSYRWVIHHV